MHFCILIIDLIKPFKFFWHNNYSKKIIVIIIIFNLVFLCIMAINVVFLLKGKTYTCLKLIIFDV